MLNLTALLDILPLMMYRIFETKMAHNHKSSLQLDEFLNYCLKEIIFLNLKVNGDDVRD